MVGLYLNRNRLSERNGTFYRLIAWKCLIYLALLYNIVRLLIIGQAVNEGRDLADYYYFDSIYTVASQQYAFLRFPYTLHIMGLVSLFMLYIDYLKTFQIFWLCEQIKRREEIAFEHYTAIAYSIANLNKRTFFRQIQDAIRFQFSVLQPVHSLRMLLQSFKQLWNKSPLHFPIKHLPNYPKPSNQLLTRGVMIFAILELVGAFFSILALSSLSLLGVILYSQMLRQPLLWYQQVLVGPIDLILHIYLIYQCGIAILFFVQCFALLTFLLRTHINELNASLALFIGRLKASRDYFISLLYFSRMKNFQVRLQLKTLLAVYHTDHQFICKIVTYFDELVISYTLLVSFFTHISLNVIMTAQCLYAELSILERNTLWVVITAEWTLLLIFCNLMVAVSQSLHCSAPLLYQAQMILKAGKIVDHSNGEIILTKLKLSNYFELVNSEKKSSFHLGWIGAVSQKTCFDAAVIYSSYLMYSFKVIRKHAFKAL